MDSPEDQQIPKEFFLELVRRYRNSQDRHGRGFDIWDAQKHEIDELFKVIREAVLPEYPDLSNTIHKETRPARTYDYELDRLWNWAICIFEKYFEGRISPVLKIIIEDGSLNGESKLKELLKVIFRNGLIPALVSQGNPGDDLFLFIRHAMMFSDEKEVAKIISQTLDTPHHTPAAIFGICGLLIQSQQASENGLMAEAYSYLIDANYMLGMYQSSEYIMERFDEVSKIRKARANAEKRHANDNRVKLGKIRARELFYSLREEGPDGVRPLWKSANKARDAIHHALTTEIHESKRTDIKIGESTILELCQELHKQEIKRRENPDYGIIEGYRLKDGTFIRYDDI
ncbi:hypothetical protein QF043_005778 [Pseudomonas sp. W3I7]|uniref:hypothetical protein n=1 Tax=Pseudomonas sp. W3I7 TaxID=3042292 RepID=UPI00278E71C2|nr:hypothetical protein [Pseudomonas sp. W3I7]MDQ0706986.1 hypothetical protein [Pseudomonas sp. W3I7]